MYSVGLMLGDKNKLPLKLTSISPIIDTLTRPNQYWPGFTLRDLKGSTGELAAPVLQAIYDDWQERPNFYRAYEHRRWGVLISLKVYVFNLNEKCLQYPQAVLQIRSAPLRINQKSG